MDPEGGPGKAAPVGRGPDLSAAAGGRGTVLFAEAGIQRGPTAGSRAEREGTAALRNSRKTAQKLKKAEK